MSFSFFTWLHNEVVALRAAVARLEWHTGVPESKPADKPADAVPPAATAAPVSPPNPFVAWKAEGRTLEWIQTFGGHPMTAADWPLAVAAGYEKQPAPGPDTGPVVDTSGPTLEFAVVQGGVPIKLDEAKTIKGCPANVIVRVFPVSGDPRAQVNYNVTINGVSYPVTGIAVFDTGSRGIAVAGPEVTVSVDSPGIEFEIQ